jgi:hypothetical protein
MSRVRIAGEMKTKLNIKRGERGTKKPSDKYGDRLVCVRYRYDPVGMKRYKTVELIEEETEWRPPEKKRETEREGSVSNRSTKEGKIPRKRKEADPSTDSTRYQPEIAGNRVGLDEAHLQRQPRKAGAKWDRKRRLWIARKEVAFNMGLQDRIEVLDVGGEQEA